VTDIRPFDIIRYCKVDDANLDASYFASKILRPILTKLKEIELSCSLTFDEWHYSRDSLRIFIAGDRSSVGKSSVCLGMIGSLLEMGYSPESLAYIKPATQSESTQLIQLFCEQQGIQCVPVGPLVYYRGFTRAFLAGETETTDQLLKHCSDAVDRVARGKRVVLVDGVGFPAVGSICGTSNAAVALACGYPTETGRRLPMGVVLVGGSGVGSAVDAFNLNATYFEQAGVPVIGGIFNKLADSGFYSLENCKVQISAYFEQNRDQTLKGREAYGFVPLFPRITGKYAVDHVKDYIHMFRTHVNVDAILQASQRIKDATSATTRVVSADKHIHKQRKLSLTSREPITLRSRQEIEAEAISSGAAPSA
jgi:dethiobiotin synthetase